MNEHTTPETNADKFWMVIGSGNGAATKKHFSRQAGFDEASRLAGADCGDRKFYVLEVVGHFEKVSAPVKFVAAPFIR